MSLNPIAWIGKALGIVDKGMDIAKEAVTDKDKQNELIANLEELRITTMYIAELQTNTVPWIDGLHKMSRSILSMSCIAATVILLLTNHEITPSVALILGGPVSAYTLIKGKGQ